VTSVPDYPQTRLALRAWMLDKAGMTVRSLNAHQGSGRQTWLSKAMASPAGAWPYDQPLAATCDLPAARRKPKSDGEPPDHGPIPGSACSCGIYATTDLDVISNYLRPTSPILGIVELGGRVIPATQGYRAAYARVAVILLIDEALTEPWKLLRKLAAAYQVPAVVPHSANPEDYRELIGAPVSPVAEAEGYLRAGDGGPA
jgi:hypothetical protein